MRVLIGLLLALAAAPSAGSAPATEEDVVARLEAGDLAGALRLTEGDSDPDRLQRLAESFYGVGSAEAVEGAVQLFERALAVRETRVQEEPEPLAALLHDLSGVHFNAGDYAKAESLEARALAIRSRALPAGDVRTAESRRDLALVLLAQGRLKEASLELPVALAAIEAAAPDDWMQRAIGRNYLAELYRLQGRSAEAAEVLEGLVQEAEAKLGEGDPHFPRFLNNLAGIYRDQGRFDEGESLLRRSLALRKAATPPLDGDIAAATLNLAEVYRVQGKRDEAAPLYDEALRLARLALPEKSPELLEFVSQKAVLAREQGRLEEARAGLLEAIELAERGLGPEHPRVAQTRLDLAGVLTDLGRCPEAEPQLRRVLEVREQVLGPEHPDVAEALIVQARCAPTRAGLDRALSVLEGSEAHREVAVDALALRADLRRRGEPEGARRDLAEALRLVETLRPHRGGGEGVRAAFFERHAPLYDRLVRWEVEAGDPGSALAAAERGRARALLDQLAAAHVGEEAPVAPELAARSAASRAELAEIRERIAFERTRKDMPAKDRRDRLEALERHLDEATRAFRLLYDEIRNADPAWRRAAAGEPASLAEIQRDVVPEGGLLLLYEVGKEGSLVFVVPRDPAPVEAKALTVRAEDAAALGVKAGPLTARALGAILSRERGGLLAQLAPAGASPARGIGGLSEGAGAEEGAELRRLHALWRVLVPDGLWPRLTQAPEVLVVPDGPLFRLPFEALVVKAGADAAAARFWLDAGPVLRYAPSATLVRDLPRHAQDKAAALTVADPVYSRLERLPATAREAAAVDEALTGLVEVTRLTAGAAREPAVRKEMTGKRYLHLATHGLLGGEEGELFAGLALTAPPAGTPARGDDDGFLQLHEIYGLPLSAELAVLSACDSNTGRLVEGEGVFALSRGFLVAGARRVVASQWPVDDASTAALMGDLFRRIGKGAEPARALRDAKRALRKNAAWSDPFFWAPFVLTGAE